jgi:DNA-binding HxlR family transcriptional regulator
VDNLRIVVVWPDSFLLAFLIRVGMKKDYDYTVVCEIISGKWTLPVVVTLQQATLRYSTIQKAIPAITERALTITLQKLERNGVVTRTSHATIPPQVEYKLTPLGLELLKVSEVMTDWAKKHMSAVQRAQAAYDRLLKQ